MNDLFVILVPSGFLSFFLLVVWYAKRSADKKWGELNKELSPDVKEFIEYGESLRIFLPYICVAWINVYDIWLKKKKKQEVANGTR